MTPFFSIVIPVYNRQHFVAKAIDSVLNQEFVNFELLLIDDCSSDDSFKILSIAAQKDSRVKVHRFEQNQGRCIARNKGIREAKGRWMCFLDSDDLYLPNHLSSLFEAIQSTPSQQAFATIQLMGDKETRYKRELVTIEDAISGNPIQLNQLTYKSNLEVYFVDERLPISEDWLFLRELLLRTSIQIIPKLTCKLLEHGERSMNMTEVQRIAHFNNYSTDLFLLRNQTSQELNQKIQSNTKLLTTNMLLSHGLKRESLKYFIQSLKYVRTYSNPLFYKAITKYILPKRKYENS